MLLFYQVVTRARRRLVLSYPAVDERGQELLPSSFLLAVLDCFHSGTVPVERRRMLIEGYDGDEPLSPAEYRVRLVRCGEVGGPGAEGLPECRLFVHRHNAALRHALSPSPMNVMRAAAQ